VSGRIVRAALTETVNVYEGMPARVEDLGDLEGRLDDVRLANVDHHVALLEAAAAAGAKVICLGELFPAPYFALGWHPMWTALAEDAFAGPTVTRLRAAARALGLVIVAPIYELDGATGRRFNTAVVIDERGEVLGTYRKTHIPYGENEQGSFHENLYYDRSDGKNRVEPSSIGATPYFPVFTTSIGRVGVAICYDRHFEGVMSSLSAGGAEIVFCPAVTFGAKSQRMWRLEFAVDAARHNVFIGGSNRRGVEAPWGQAYFGDSHFVGPNGAPVDVAAGHPNLVIADLDLGELSQGDPAGWNLPRDIRYDIYASRTRK
jgi:N-carbamoylputrescine amidase